MSAEQYEQDLKDISQKQLLLEVLVELKAIRHGMQTGDYGTTPQSESEPADDSPNGFRCETCQKVVPESERARHLVEQHNAPAELDPQGEFTPV